MDTKCRSLWPVTTDDLVSSIRLVPFVQSCPMPDSNQRCFPLPLLCSHFDTVCRWSLLVRLHDEVHPIPMESNRKQRLSSTLEWNMQLVESTLIWSGATRKALGGFMKIIGLVGTASNKEHVRYDHQKRISTLPSSLACSLKEDSLVKWQRNHVSVPIVPSDTDDLLTNRSKILQWTRHAVERNLQDQNRVDVMHLAFLLVFARSIRRFLPTLKKDCDWSMRWSNWRRG